MRRLSVILFFAALLAVFSITPAVSQTYDIILIEKPRNLTMYDAFQQSTASAQLPDIQPFVPMKVLKTRDILSDGFTHCMRVEINGKTYFLLYDEKGKLAGWNIAGVIKTYKGKESLLDTILVLKKILFNNYADNKQSYIKTGERCVRYFRHDGSTYIKRLVNDQKFGWIKIIGDEEGKTWKIVQAVPAQMELSAALRERIIGRVKQANGTLMQVYSILNRESGRRIETPQWQQDPRSETLGFIFLPDQAVSVYPQSMDILKSTLQTYLLGTNYNVVITGNRVDIKQR